MEKLSIDLPAAMLGFVQDQVAAGRYSNESEYIQSLIRREHDRFRLRATLLDGAASPCSGAADASYFQDLRERVRNPG